MIPIFMFSMDGLVFNAPLVWYSGCPPQKGLVGSSSSKYLLRSLHLSVQMGYLCQGINQVQHAQFDRYICFTGSKKFKTSTSIGVCLSGNQPHANIYFDQHVVGQGQNHAQKIYFDWSISIEVDVLNSVDSLTQT